MEHLKKLMEKKMKKEPAMSEDKKVAKMAALKALHDDMRGMMGEGLGDHLKKVTVAAPDKEHLQKGLEAARGMVSSLPENNEEEGAEHESEESPEMESQEHEETPEESQSIDQHMQREEEHEQQEENEIADLKKQIEELKQLILSSR